MLSVRSALLQGRHPGEKVGGRGEADNGRQHCFVAWRICEPRWQQGLCHGRGKERGGSRLIPCPCPSFVTHRLRPNPCAIGLTGVNPDAAHARTLFPFAPCPLVLNYGVLNPMLQDCQELIPALRLQGSRGCATLPPAPGSQLLRPNPFARRIARSSSRCCARKTTAVRFRPPPCCSVPVPEPVSPRRTARS